MAINDNTSYELFGYQVKDLATKIKSKAETASLAPVATSGLYSDLTGAPTIPTVYNGTLTIQQDGATVGTFTANQSTDTTVNLAGGAIETVGSGNNICYKFPDGLMIACVRVDTTYTVGSWAGWYESQAINPPNFAQAFIATPFCTASIVSTNAQCVIGSGSGHSGSSSPVTASRGQTVIVCRPNNVSGNISIVWQAIGRWK